MNDDNISEESSDYSLVIDYGDQSEESQQKAPVIEEKKPKAAKRPKKETSRENVAKAVATKKENAYKKKMNQFIQDTMRRDDSDMVFENFQLALGRGKNPEEIVRAKKATPLPPPKNEQNQQTIKIVLEKKFREGPKKTASKPSPQKKEKQPAVQKLRYNLINFN